MGIDVATQRAVRTSKQASLFKKKGMETSSELLSFFLLSRPVLIYACILHINFYNWEDIHINVAYLL